MSVNILMRSHRNVNMDFCACARIALWTWRNCYLKLLYVLLKHMLETPLKFTSEENQQILELARRRAAYGNGHLDGLKSKLRDLNFGPDEDDAKPVSWIADHLVTLWGEGARWTRDGSVQPHEAAYLKLDCAKAKTRLDWHPKLSLSPALEWTVAWYQAHQKKTDMRRFTLDQIARYQSMVNG